VTIRPGDPWGVPVVHDPTIRVAHDERAAISAWNLDAADPVFLQRGSLRRALGLPKRGSEHRTSVTCDVVCVNMHLRGLDREEHALGNVVVVSRSLRPGMWILTNTGWWSGRHLATRAHPNDGLLDVLEVDRLMTWTQRVRAFRRARRGDHLPHPRLRAGRGERHEIEHHGRLHVWIDGVYAGRADRVAAKVIPDAIEVRA